MEVEQGNLDSAGRRLDALVANMPTIAPANRVLGIVNGRRGQYRQAQMYLQSAINQAQDRRAVLHLAKLHLDNGDPAAARESLQRMLAPQQQLSDTLLYALAARLGLQILEDGLAAEFLEVGLEASSGEMQELLALASVYSQSGEVERAQALLQEQSEGDGDAAWIATFGLALTQLQQGQLDAADQTAARLAEMLPTSAHPQNLRGMIAGSKQDFGTAIEYFSAALSIEAEYIPALMNRGQLYGRQGRLDDAVRDYRAVLDIDANNAAALLALAELDIASRNYGQAKEWLDRAPESARRMQLRGAIALAEGQPALAADIFQQVFEQEPSAQHAVQAYSMALRASLEEPEAVLRTWLAEHPRDAAVNFTLGSYLLDIGNHREATERFEAVVAVNPGHAPALNNLAWLYGEAGDGRAMEFAERAYTAAPDNPAIADTLGWLRVQNGDARNGLPLIEQSHRAIPDNAEIHYHFASALAATGQNQRAAEELQRLLAAHPDSEINAEAERLLQEVQ